MVSVKFFMLLLVRPLLADVATCSAPDLCKDELAIEARDFALAVGKEGPEESLELLQVKKVSWQHELLFFLPSYSNFCHALWNPVGIQGLCIDMIVIYLEPDHWLTSL